MPRPTVVSLAEENRIVSTSIAARARGGAPLEILEAGCGREWTIALPGVSFRLTGVDLDAHALQARQSIARDLDHAVVGDLRTVDMPAESFDVIVCSYVLEHVDGAAAALDNMLRWLRPGGLLVVRVPDRESAFGFIARNTPFWFHVAVWRYVYGIREAGQPGHAPYPTSYDAVLGSGGMQQLCLAHGLGAPRVLGHSGLYGSGLRLSLVRGCLRFLALSSGGSLAAGYNNLTFLVEKPSPSAVPAAVGS